MMRRGLVLLLAFWVLCSPVEATRYHVSKNGNDKHPGSPGQPFLTIQAAASIARADDIIIVHEGIYRERVDPIHGGKNDLNRIIYQAADGEKVVIKGSEIVKDWEKVNGSVWKAKIPNSLFGDYNPYSELVEGDWFNPEGIRHHTGEVFINGSSLFEQNSLQGVRDPVAHAKAVDPSASLYTWYCDVGDEITTIWANFQELDPKTELVEVNVREVCFYPSRTGVNYITVRGFEMSQAATQWAAPTAEQPGLIGTHWSRGWIIENNVVSNSKSVGITLGKDRATGHNVWMHNRQKDGATHYNEVIFRALEAGWSKEKIGSHTVRHNVIFDCGQAGIVGSLGGVFSNIHDNHIYDIYTKRTYSGAEMGGIKIHASIDMLIEHNRIHNCFIGIWLDWMAQGARVTRNVLYDNSHHDFFTEVNHGPYLVDNNLFLTSVGLSIQDASEGGAFVHNLFAGRIKTFNVPNRVTPYHHPHSTQVLCLRNIRGGDNRFFNNIYIRTGELPDETFTDGTGQHISIGYGFDGYDGAEYRSLAAGNVFYHGAKPYKEEVHSIQKQDYAPQLEIEEKGDELILKLHFDRTVNEVKTQLVTTQILGTTIVSEALFERRDGLPYSIDTDFFRKQRNGEQPGVGPFESLDEGSVELIIW